jgi:hypothetical protein
MEAVFSSETLVTSYRTTYRDNREAHTIMVIQLIKRSVSATTVLPRVGNINSNKRK